VVAEQRIERIDLLRGIVMVLMVVDHAREYSSGPGRVSDPMQLDQVTPLLFTLRWVSHFCAPVFAFLMGLSAGFRPNPRHLAVRGFILLLLEFTIIDWSWTFYPLWPRKFWQVIAALGMSSILLAVFARFGHRAVLALGAAIVALHNLFDGISFPPDTAQHYLWSFLHQKNVLPLGAGFEVRTTYPFLPVAGVAMLGFGFAPWFHHPGVTRLTGAAMCCLFLLLRLTNLYGDSSLYTGGWQSLGNVTKYPLSLQFVLMTLGPAMLFLSLRSARGIAPLVTLGRAPMFFYIAHLYLLHAAALGWALAQGHSLPPFHLRFGGVPEAFGFPLWGTLPFALLVTALLVPASGWYAKQRSRYAALRFL
jgi:uncharacterized membrane protein